VPLVRMTSGTQLSGTPRRTGYSRSST